LRRIKRARKSGKGVRAAAKGALAVGRDKSAQAYSGTVRTARYWKRVQLQTAPRLAREISVRGELRAVARGDGPIIVGPWLSEVGYEVLYWVPFLRWFCHRYDVHPSRMTVVSRGGVADWYRSVANHYIELLDLFDVKDFATRNAERQRRGEQKQHALADFDLEILGKVRESAGLTSATVCHPSLMFRLLRHFWLGNESLHYVQEHTRYTPLELPPMQDLPRLPERFVAIKFYTGKAIPDTPHHRQLLRFLVERLASRYPIVALDTGLALDEHEDYLFGDIPGITTLDGHLTPQNNLGLQAAVIRKAMRFVGTCGSLAWLAPFLGTKTLAVYADDDFLTPHLYAARQAYRTTGAASFATLDLNGLALAGLEERVVVPGEGSLR
jgi:hypothetical protein